MLDFTFALAPLLLCPSHLMAARREVLLTLPESFHLARLPSYKQSASANRLESTLVGPLASVHSKELRNHKSFRINTYKKHGGEGRSPAWQLPLFSSRAATVPTCFPTIPFVFILLRTLWRHGHHATLLESIRCALFPSSRGCTPPILQCPVLFLAHFLSLPPYFVTSLPRC